MIIETLHNEQRTIREEETSRGMCITRPADTHLELQLGPKETIKI